MQNKYLIIVNKTANQGRTKKLWSKIQVCLDQRHVNYNAISTKYHKNAILITEEFIKQANSNDILLVIGGDGTLNEVINGSKKIINLHPQFPTLPIGYIPTGEHNNFAKRHMISLNWHKALINILNNGNHSHQIKIGYFDEHIKHQRKYFLNDIGIGLNADLINILHNSKISWKALRYFIAIFYLLYNLQSFTMEIYHTHKTKIYHKVFLANITLSTSKNHNFDLIIIERHNLLLMFYIFLRLFLKKPMKFKSVHRFKVNQLHLGIPTLEYGHADGEELGDRFYDLYVHTTTYPFM